MTHRTLLYGLGLVAAHLLATLALLRFVVGAGMAWFDSGALPTVTERILSAVLAVLMQPMRSLWPVVKTVGMAGALEWPLVLLNSVLWGFALLGVWQVVRRPGSAPPGGTTQAGPGQEP